MQFHLNHSTVNTNTHNLHEFICSWIIHILWHITRTVNKDVKKFCQRPVTLLVLRLVFRNVINAPVSHGAGRTRPVMLHQGVYSSLRLLVRNLMPTVNPRNATVTACGRVDKTVHGPGSTRERANSPYVIQVFSRSLSLSSVHIISQQWWVKS